MIDDLTTHAVLLAHALVGGIRARVRTRGRQPEDGVSTLEMVIIALGLMAVAALLVTAITLAVTRRTNQIK